MKEQAIDMAQSFVSVVATKIIEKAAEQGERVEISVLAPHDAELGRRIAIQFNKGGDANINIVPLNSILKSGDNLDTFIGEYLPDYYHLDDVLHADIYSRYLNNEEVDESDLKWIHQDFGSDTDEVEKELDRLEKRFAYEALLNWLESHGPESWK